MVQQINFNDPVLKAAENVQTQAQLQVMQQQASRAAEAVQPFDAVLQTTVDRGRR